jgi:citrate lyase subunit alpha/citrate CoA-transferase
VDYIVEIPEIGDKNKIMSGATRYTNNPRDLLIAQKRWMSLPPPAIFTMAFHFKPVRAALLWHRHFFCVKRCWLVILKRILPWRNYGQIVKLHEEGLIKKLLDDKVLIWCCGIIKKKPFSSAD